MQFTFHNPIPTFSGQTGFGFSPTYQPPPSYSPMGGGSSPLPSNFLQPQAQTSMRPAKRKMSADDFTRFLNIKKMFGFGNQEIFQPMSQPQGNMMGGNSFSDGPMFDDY